MSSPSEGRRLATAPVTARLTYMFAPFICADACSMWEGDREMIPAVAAESVWFASSRACSKSGAPITAATGPDISSVTNGEPATASSTTMGPMKLPAVGQVLATQHDTAELLRTILPTT